MKSSAALALRTSAFGIWVASCTAAPLNLTSEACDWTTPGPSTVQCPGAQSSASFIQRNGPSSDLVSTSDGVEEVSMQDLSAIEPDPSLVKYEPQNWNDEPSVQRSHNCYEYALDDIDPVAKRKCAEYLANGKKPLSCRRWFHIPGYANQFVSMLGAPMRRYQRNLSTCASLLKRVAGDNVRQLIWKNAQDELLKQSDSCPSNAHYLAALVVDPGQGFHFYRRDHACRDAENAGRLCWSHKPGINPVIRVDGLNKEMPDLDKAARYYGIRHKDNGEKVPKTYKDICGYFCVPGNDQQVTHSSFFLHRRL